MKDRARKLNDLLRDEVAYVLARAVELPTGTMVTVARAEVSSTVEHVRVWLSVFPPERAEEVLKMLRTNIRDIQDRLNERLVLRTVPKIILKVDRREERAEEVGDLLDTLPPAP